MKIRIISGSLIMLAIVLVTSAFAGSANHLSSAELSIVGGETDRSIVITPCDPVQFRLDVTASRSSYPKIYVVPMVTAEDRETGEPVTAVVGDRFLTGITGLKGKGNAPRSDSATFTSDDLGVAFSKSNTYQFFVQVWDEGKLLRTSNPVTITVVEKPFTGVVFTAKRTAVYKAPYVVDYYNWSVLIDGQEQVVRVYPSAYTFEGAFLTASTGVYRQTSEYAAGSVTEKVVAYPGIIDGYGLNPAVGRTITLGVKDTEYHFADDARIYRLDVPAAGAEFEIGIEDIPYSWNGRYWMLLNSWGEIRYLFISYSGATPPNPDLFNTMKKFNPAEGPADPDSGLTTEYVYFKPENPSTSDNGKFPLFIWLHGSGQGANVWTPLINDYHFLHGRGISKFADIHQPLFHGGGAYIMIPRSNEDFAEGHGMRWNTLQVGAFFAAVDDFLAKNPEIDRDRIYVGGFSIGGGMVWSVIRERPGFFAAALPVAAPGRFMPDPNSPEINNFVSLPIWAVHSVQDTVVMVDTDTQVTPNIPWGSRPVMNAIIPLATAAGTDSRLTLLHPVYYLGAHLEYVAVCNNMVNPYYTDGRLYANGLTMSDPYDYVESTVIDWLNAQTASANASRR